MSDGIFNRLLEAVIIVDPMQNGWQAALEAASNRILKARSAELIDFEEYQKLGDSISNVIRLKTDDHDRGGDAVTLAHSPMLNGLAGMEGISRDVAQDAFRSGAKTVEVYVGKRMVFTNLAAFIDWENGIKSNAPEKCATCNGEGGHEKELSSTSGTFVPCPDCTTAQNPAASGRELPRALEFANHVINGVFDGGDWDGGDLQKLAIDYGLLKPTEMKECCGENCACAENGADFPAICYRKTYVLTGGAPADTTTPTEIALRTTLHIVEMKLSSALTATPASAEAFICEALKEIQDMLGASKADANVGKPPSDRQAMSITRMLALCKQNPVAASGLVAIAANAPTAPEVSKADSEPRKSESIIACLQDDAAKLEQETPGCEMAANMRAAADYLESLEEEQEDSHGTLSRLSTILRGVAVALKGPEGPVYHSWHDLAEKAQETAQEAARLKSMINTPELYDFAKGVVLEAVHQLQKWGTSHDGGKTPADWFWLIGYLAQKAMMHQISGDNDKALHHMITTAAACANWHASLNGGVSNMRPGIDPATLEKMLGGEKP